MKTGIFILNAVSAILIFKLLFINPTVTGFAILETELKFDWSSPVGFAVIFIIVTISLDIYFYMKSRKSSQTF